MVRGRGIIAFNRLLAILVGFVALASGNHAGAAPTHDEKARTVVHLLDYVAVDYPVFVKDGQVLDDAEYAEQQEFAGQVVVLLGELPAVGQSPALLAEARELGARIAARADGTVVAGLARALRSDVIAAYDIAQAPRQVPDMATAAGLYAQQCATCHGTTGHGDGPQAQGLAPAPRNFHDAAAMDERSIFALFNAISLGVPGTAMPAYGALSDEERWALAFHVASLRNAAEVVARGEAAWKRGEGRDEFKDLRTLVTTTPLEVQQRHGAGRVAVQAYLIAHPEALAATAPSPLAVTRTRLQAALDAYRNGDRATARQLAVSAYLDGFELIEAALDNVDAPLRKATEREMMALRSLIADGAPADSVADGIARIDALLDRVDARLTGEALSPEATFFSSLLILLREGLEAILVLAAIIALVIKTGRRDALPYIHAGWIGAVALGIVTWLIARYALTISGASRETTEGVTALLAAAMLLYVGYWLHDKSHAQGWQRFIREQVDAALGKRTLWALAGISFLAVYRELFEIILFYEALLSQAGPDGLRAVLGGIGAAAVLLVLVGAAILKFSVRMPLGPFFAATAGLLALMAVVFTGNGVAALQEAGVIPSTQVDFVTIPVLGIYPTIQGLGAQGAMVALVVAGALVGRRKATG